MKKFKKLLSFLLVMVMLFSMTTIASAADTATITVNSGTTGVSMMDRVLSAYRILDMKKVSASQANNKETYVYTVPAEWKTFYVDFFRSTLTGNEADFDALVVEKINNYTISGTDVDPDKVNEFAEAALAYAKTYNVANNAQKTGTSTDSIVFENLADGYYLISDDTVFTDNESKVISAVMLNSTDINIDIKANPPGLEKTVEDVKITNGAIGDHKVFTLTSTVPDMTGYSNYKFVIKDTMDAGLHFGAMKPNTTATENFCTDTAHAFTIKMEKYELDVNGTYYLLKSGAYTTTAPDSANADKYANTTDTYAQKESITLESSAYTVTANRGTPENDKTYGVTDIKIVLNDFIQYKAKAGYTIIVSYCGIINEDVTVEDIPNKNEAVLLYSNNPTKEGTGDDFGENEPFGITPKTDSQVYSTELILYKTDDKGNKLAGAEFELAGIALNQALVTKEEFVQDNKNGTYWKLKDGTFTTTDPTTPNMDQTKYENLTDKYILTASTDLVPQTTNASGQKAIKGTVDQNGKLVFKGLAAGTYTITETKSPKGYKLLKDSITAVVTLNVDNTGAATVVSWGYAYNDGDNPDGLVNVENNTTNTLTVQNTTGTLLPTTGGMGTTILYIAGAIMVLAAMILLVVKRRMNCED